MIFDVILTKLRERWQDEIHEIVVGWFSLTLGSVLSAGGEVVMVMTMRRRRPENDDEGELAMVNRWWGLAKSTGDGFLSTEALHLKDHFDCTGSHIS